MKKLLQTIGVFGALSMSVSAAADIISAESMAINYDNETITSLMSDFNHTTYDGPYNGEKAVKPCSIYEGNTSCLDYNSVKYGENAFEELASNTTQTIEDFVFYNAYLNVVAGYYNHKRPQYEEYIAEVGKKELIQKEVHMLKSGQKEFSLRHQFLTNATNAY